MFAYRTIIALLAIVLLSACANSSPNIPTPTSSTGSIPTVAPTTEPTVAPTVARTVAPTAEPTAEPTVAPTAEPTAEPTTAPTAEPTVAPTAAPSTGSELLFLRGGALVALNLADSQVRTLAPDVRDFAASADGRQIALLRGEGTQTEIWLVQRDGSGLTQLTQNDRNEATLAWAPDGSALLFGSSSSATAYKREWQAWAAWCVASDVRLLTLSDTSETTLAPGCDPAWSPDGRRIAFATPPTAADDAMSSSALLTVNAIRLINNQGQNGWDFAKASGPSAAAPHQGRLVYAPTFSPDGSQVLYQRFMGYQALVDINFSQIAPSFDGGGNLVEVGGGWMLPARFAPDSKTVALGENNYSDARGFGGYDNWSVSVIRLEGTHQIALPEGEQTAQGQQLQKLPRAQTIAWSPNGERLAVLLPPGWSADLPEFEALEIGEEPGEIWSWTPGQAPSQRIVDQVDFASPLAWLP